MRINSGNDRDIPTPISLAGGAGIAPPWKAVAAGVSGCRRNKWETKDEISGDCLTYFKAKLEGAYPELRLNRI
jgi:hypothetical protein